MNAIEQCLKMSRAATDVEIQSIGPRITSVEEVISRAKDKKKRLLGVEKGALKVLSARIKELEQERARLSQVAKFGNMQCMSLDALKLRDAKGWPTIALMSLDSSRVQFGFVGRHKQDGYGYMRKYWSKSFQPSLPAVLQECYADVFELLKKMAGERKQSVYLAADYEGIIPDATLEKIAAARSRFKQVFIAAEVKKWDLSFKDIPTPRPRNVDPLIVGFDGTNLWVVDHFDLTPVEQYVKDEFSIKP